MTYSSPEFVGNNVQYDKTTDVFSIGVILYSLVQLKSPYECDGDGDNYDTEQYDNLKEKIISHNYRPMDFDEQMA